MPVTVKRFGGMLPRPPRERRFAFDELDKSARDEILRLAKESDAPRPRVPDAFTYKFELDEANQPHAEFALSGTQVPDALRKLLP